MVLLYAFTYDKRINSCATKNKPMLILVIKAIKVVVELCSDTTHPVTMFHNARIHSGYHVHVVSTSVCTNTFISQIDLNIKQATISHFYCEFVWISKFVKWIFWGILILKFARCVSMKGGQLVFYIHHVLYAWIFTLLQGAKSTVLFSLNNFALTTTVVSLI